MNDRVIMDAAMSGDVPVVLAVADERLFEANGSKPGTCDIMKPGTCDILKPGL